MENAQEQMEVSQCENMLQVDAQANQMEQLAKNVDHIQIASGSVNNNSGSSNLEENVIQVEEVIRGEEVIQIEEVIRGEEVVQVEEVIRGDEVIRGEEVIQAEEEGALINPQNVRRNEYEIPGCVKCMMDECGDPWCKWCTLGFCTKGQLCKNIYSHFAMCGRETNFCKDYRLRGSRNGGRFQI